MMVWGAFRAEWFKLTRRPGVWETIGLLLVLAVGIGYLLTYLVATHPPNLGDQGRPSFVAIRRGLYPASLVTKALTNANTLDAIFPLILGVLAQGSELGWGTVKTVQTQLPGRLSILAGQLIALGLLLWIMVLGIFGIGAVASWLIATVDRAPMALPPAASMLGGIGSEWLIFAFAAGLGFALATLFRESAMAIGLGLGYLLVIESLVFGVLDASGHTFETVHELLPVMNAAYLQQAFGQAPGIVGFVISPGRTPDASQGALVLGAWTAALIALAAVLIRVRDVT